jgi:hypothetical protein
VFADVDNNDQLSGGMKDSGSARGTLTLIHADFLGNARFPDYSKFRKVVERTAHDNGTYRYDFVTLEE